MTRLARARFHLAQAQRHLTVHRLRGGKSAFRAIQVVQQELLTLDLKLNRIQALESP